MTPLGILQATQLAKSLRNANEIKDDEHNFYCSSYMNRAQLTIAEVAAGPIAQDVSIQMLEQNKIVFKVPSNANKKNLKNNIEKIFKVNVTKINIINKQSRIKLTRGRKVKVSGFKKAIITLKKGQSIDLTTGI